MSGKLYSEEAEHIGTIESELSDLKSRLRMAEDALSDIARGVNCPHAVAEGYFRNFDLTSMNYRDEDI